MNTNDKTNKEKLCKCSVGKVVNLWVQTIGIICAGVWAAWSFYFKDIFIPKSTPINISLNLQLKKLEPNRKISHSGINTMIPVELKVIASNPSQRVTYILPSEWIVYGTKNISKRNSYNNSYIFKGISSINKQMAGYSCRHTVFTETPIIVALGSLSNDVQLKPSETIYKTVIFHVPEDEYELLTIQTTVVSTARKNSIKIEWYRNPKTGTPDFNAYRIDKYGQLNKISKNEQGVHLLKDDEFQVFISSAMLSL